MDQIILGGRSDPFFRWKNEYTEEIKPYAVGPQGDQSAAMVIENRHPEAFKAVRDWATTKTRKPMNQWYEEMQRVAELVKACNQRPQ